MRGIKTRHWSIFHSTGELLHKTNNAKAYLYAGIALLWSIALQLGPLIVGIWLVFQGEWLKAILIPIVLYLTIGFYMAFWPFIAVFIFIAGWIKYSFIESLLGTVTFVFIAFILFLGPEWLMLRAFMAAEKAEKLKRRTYVSDDTVFDDTEYKEDLQKEFTSIPDPPDPPETEELALEESTEASIAETKEEITFKRDIISELSEEVVSLKRELAFFEAKYHSQIGILYVNLDGLELSIKEYLKRIELLKTGKVKNLVDLEKTIKEHFRSDYEQIREEKEEAERYTEEYEAVKEKPELDEESEKRLKSLYRELAKKYHPDMAQTPEEKERFHKIMAEINQAYNDKDLEKMEELAMRLKAPERTFFRETLEEEFQRLQNESEKLDEIISRLEEELLSIKGSDTYKFKQRADEASAQDRDLLKEMEDKLMAEIKQKEEDLRKVKQEFKNLAKDLA
ncbi:MAG: DnaJ domain-containing protein [Nitrospirae bacterium]|nr:DnaJ domain-containing protein [Nitrospirota bacterium]